MTESYIEVSDQNFAKVVLQAPQMVLVNFSVESSGACQIQNTEFEAVSKEYQEKIAFVKIDAEKNGETTSRSRIDGIPTILFFKNGKEIYRIKGIIMRDKLRRSIEGALLSNQ